MAGVGFSLRALRRDNSFSSVVERYGAAALISSGPWLMSILTLLFIGSAGSRLGAAPVELERFQVSVTWLFAASLLWTGPLQLMFTRYCADLEYRKQQDRVLPNLIGALAGCAALSGGLALALWPLFAAETLRFKLALSVAFVVLCQVWLAVLVLQGIRAHRAVLASFAAGYGTTFVACLACARYGATGLLLGFALGQATLLYVALYVLYRALPASSDVSFDFLRRKALIPELGVMGFAYNVGVWADKLIFWLNPATSRRVLGPLYASEVYDLPIFLAYLTSVPAMAVFLLRVETDFAEHHAAFYSGVRDGATLRRLEALSAALTSAARRALFDIVRVQAIAIVLASAAGELLLRSFGISDLHLPLFYIDATGVSLQVLLLAVTSIFFYLDRRREVLVLTLMLLACNALFSWITQQLGPLFYGYGFALATGVTSLYGVLRLDRTFTHLVRDTFMRQPVAA
jgi:polysaccharide biosynthesis protein PelG